MDSLFSSVHKLLSTIHILAKSSQHTGSWTRGNNEKVNIFSGLEYHFSCNSESLLCFESSGLGQ